MRRRYALAWSGPSGPTIQHDVLEREAAVHAVGDVAAGRRAHSAAGARTATGAPISAGSKCMRTRRSSTTFEFRVEGSPDLLEADPLIGLIGAGLPIELGKG